MNRRSVALQRGHLAVRPGASHDIDTNKPQS
jgi:hypothetical protein